MLHCPPSLPIDSPSLTTSSQTWPPAPLGRCPPRLGALHPLPPPNPPGAPHPSPPQPPLHRRLQPQHPAHLQQLRALPVHPPSLARPHHQQPRRRDPLHRSPRRARPNPHRHDPHPRAGLPRVPQIHLRPRGNPLPRRAPARAYWHAPRRRAAHRPALQQHPALRPIREPDLLPVAPELHRRHRHGAPARGHPRQLRRLRGRHMRAQLRRAPALGH